MPDKEDGWDTDDPTLADKPFEEVLREGDPDRDNPQPLA